MIAASLADLGPNPQRNTVKNHCKMTGIANSKLDRCSHKHIFTTRLNKACLIMQGGNCKLTVSLLDLIRAV